MNKWSVNFPAENQERPNSIKFKLKNFYRAFLGLVNYEIKNDENEIIFPRGLNYYISCESGCNRIIRCGFGTKYPILDIQHDTLECPSCNKPLNNINRIKTIILYKASGTITFRIEGEIEVKQIGFNTTNNQLVIFGDRFVRFDQLIIETMPL